MVAAKGKTGNPGVSNPKKKNSTSFAVEGDEPKAKTMSFRPKRSLYERIEKALYKSGLERSEFLELAVSAYLPVIENFTVKSPRTEGETRKELNREFQNKDNKSSDNSGGTEEPTAAEGDKAPTGGGSNTST